jgi:hypothetical protein
LQELFGTEEQKEIIKMYSQLRITNKRDEDQENKIPDYTITLNELKSTIYSNLMYTLTDEILELIFYALRIPLKQDTEIDFLLFVKIYYLIYNKINAVEKEEEQEEGNMVNEMFTGKDEEKKVEQEEINNNESQEQEQEENSKGEQLEEMESQGESNIPTEQKKEEQLEES